MMPSESGVADRLTLAILLGFTAVAVPLVGAFPSFPGTIAVVVVSLVTVVAGLRYDRATTNTVTLEPTSKAAPTATDGGQEVEE